MKKVILFALIAALCAGLLLYLYLDKLEKQKEVEVVYESVVVAATDIPAFTSISAAMVTMAQVPQGYSHPRATRSLEEVVGFVTEGDIVQGEQILPVKLKQVGGEESGLSYIIPQGMRAVTIPVDGITGVAGFIRRGDYVDVVAFASTTYLPQSEGEPADEEAEPADGEAGQEERAQQQTQGTTLIAAQNVCVAAVGASLADTATGADAGDSAYGSVTLFLTPEDAMRVIQGARSGTLILILRATGEHERNTQPPMISDMLLMQAE